MYWYFLKIAGLGSGSYIYYWKSNGFSDKRINFIKTTGSGITPKLIYYAINTRVEFNGCCLKQDKIMHTHGKMVNIYFVYELTGSNSDDSDPTIKNSLLCAVTLTKKADIDKYQYSVIELDLIEEEVFHFHVVDLPAM